MLSPQRDKKGNNCSGTKWGWWVIERALKKKAWRKQEEGKNAFPDSREKTAKENKLSASIVLTRLELKKKQNNINKKKQVEQKRRSAVTQITPAA